MEQCARLAQLIYFGTVIFRFYRNRACCRLVVKGAKELPACGREATLEAMRWIRYRGCCVLTSVGGAFLATLF
jgi:hypothetical protein